MLEQIKTAMRISHDKLDIDIQHNIDACLLDLKRVGIIIPANELIYPELIRKAVENYCKWQYDYCGKGEQFEKNYSKLRDAMSLCKEYTTEADGNV